MKLKKLAAMLAAFCMVCCAVPLSGYDLPETSVLTASAADLETIQEGSTDTGLKYEIQGTYSDETDEDGNRIIASKDKVYIVGYEGASSSVEIPSEIDGIPVTRISNLYSELSKNCVVPKGAFEGCSSLIEVTLPEGITDIEDSAFLDCSKLQKADIPTTVTNIMGSAFSNTALTILTLPEGLTTIGDNAFHNTKITTVTFPESLTYIGNSAFENCGNLTIVDIPSNVTMLGDSAFGWSGVTNVTIAEGITALPDYVFQHCSSLKNVTLPSSIVKIGEKSFDFCSSIDELVIPENVVSVGDAAFAMCEFEKITLPDSLASMADTAFGKHPKSMFGYLPSTDTSHPENLVICANPGTYADSYAEKYNISFTNLQTGETITRISDQEPTDEPDTETLLPGDANGDNAVDVSDIILINKAIYNKASLTDAQLTAIDFNKNGKPDAADSLLLMKYIIKLVDSFE